MKILNLVLCLILVAISNSQANDLSPLSNYTKKMKGDVGTVEYVWERCSAVLLFYAVKLSPDSNKPEDMTPASKKSMEFSDAYSEALEKMYQQYDHNSPEQAANRALKIKFDIFKIYSKDSGEIYVRTGNVLGEYIKEDIATCLKIGNEGKI